MQVCKGSMTAQAALERPALSLPGARPAGGRTLEGSRRIPSASLSRSGRKATRTPGRFASRQPPLPPFLHDPLPHAVDGLPEGGVVFRQGPLFVKVVLG